MNFDAITTAATDERLKNKMQLLQAKTEEFFG